MAGTIIADTLTHSTAGSVTTDYVVNGSSKAWVNFDGTGTIAARDSLNLSSLVDDGVSFYTVNYSSSLANANYCLVTGNKYTGAGSGISLALRNVTTPLTTSSCELHAVPDYSVTQADNPFVMIDIKGDLA